jgi:hypothetical protein
VVKDKLKALHSELDAGVRTVQGYTVEAAVADWLAEGLPGRAAKTVEVYRDALRPALSVIGRIPLRDLTVQDVRTALAKMAVTHSTPTLQKAHNCLTRALRHAEGRDLVRRNVSALVDTPHGRKGRSSQALTVEQAAALLEAAEDSRLHAFIVLCLLLPRSHCEGTPIGGQHVTARLSQQRRLALAGLGVFAAGLDGGYCAASLRGTAAGKRRRAAWSESIRQA